MRILFQGDSITDAGRDKRNYHNLGNGYPKYAAEFIKANHPDADIEFINFGIGGNRTGQLFDRIYTDAVEFDPDIISIMIGINDVWRQFDVPTIPDYHVLPEEYEQNLIKIIEKTLPHVKGMVLMTPYYIESNPQDAMRARMDEYGAICKKF